MGGFANGAKKAFGGFGNPMGGVQQFGNNFGQFQNWAGRMHMEPWRADSRPGWLNNAGNQVFGWGEQHGLDPLGGDKFLANGLGFKDPRVIKAQNQARINAQTQSNLAAQRGMSSGLMGGAQAGGQIQAYNNVLADSASQRAQLQQADQQSGMQNIGLLLSLIGML